MEASSLSMPVGTPLTALPGGTCVGISKPLLQSGLSAIDDRAQEGLFFLGSSLCSLGFTHTVSSDAVVREGGGCFGALNIEN